MKKKFAVLVFILLCILVACNGTTTSLTAKKNSFYLSLNGTVDINDYIEQEGNGKLYYAVENTDVLKLDGSKVTGIAEGKGVIVVESDGYYVRIAVEVVDNRRVFVSLQDATAVYDGTAHYPEIVGSLPEGSGVKYYCNDAPFEGATDAGEYTVTVEASVPEPFYVEYGKKTATLTVEKKSVDLSGLTFATTTYTYDGSEKKLEITGTLPEGVSVSYRNNVGTDAGTYAAEAIFSVPENNYNPVNPWKADLIIRKKYIDLADYGFGSTTVTYDGAPHALLFSSLPEGTTCRYYRLDGEEKVYLPEGYGYVDSGEYYVYATLSTSAAFEKNHAFVSGETLLVFSSEGERAVSLVDASARLLIRKGSFYSDYTWSLKKGEESVLSVPYGKQLKIGEEGEYTLRLEGSSHGLNGEFPQGAQIEYSRLTTNAYGNVDSGIYMVTAIFIMPEGATRNYLALPEKSYSLTITRGQFSMEDVLFTYDTSEAVFDPDAYYNDFAIDVTNAPWFSSALSVEYTYKRDGNLIGVLAENKIHSAGVYEIIATFTVESPDKKNYYTPAPKSVFLTVKPVTVEMELTFDSVTVTYDRLPHEIKVLGELPEGVRMSYSCGELNNLNEVIFTNAGEYVARAIFTYGDERLGTYRMWENVNYVLKNKGEVITYLSADLIINKATIDVTQVDLSNYTQLTHPTYSPALTARDIGIANDPDGYVRFKNADEKIKLLGTVRERVAYCSVDVLYNCDVNNYIDYPFTIRAEIDQAEIPLASVTVPDQFVGYTGSIAVPVVNYAGAEELLSASVAAQTNLLSLGKHVCTVTLTPKDPVGYYTSGDNVYNDVNVYIYNLALFEYAPGTCSLVLFRGTGNELSVLDGTTGIRAGAFRNSSFITSLTLPDSITEIAEGGLNGLTQLSTLSLSHVLNLSGIFSVVPETLTHVVIRSDDVVPSLAFKGQLTLQKVTYLSEVSSVEPYAFDGCSYLKEIVFANVPTYKQASLSGCRSLLSLTVKDFPSAGYFFDTATLDNYKLQKVTLTEGNRIGDEAFKGLLYLQEVILPATLETIGKRAFYATSATIDLSATSMTTIGENSFEGFNGTLTFPVSLQTLEAFAFYRCGSERLVFPIGTVTIGQNAFSGCTAEIVFHADSLISEIGEKAFYQYAGSSFSIPASVTRIGVSAFEKSDLLTLTVPQGTVLSENCFKDCARLTEVVLSCEDVPDSAFYGCVKLTAVTFNSTATIGESAFAGCGITSITFPEALTYIGSYAFSGCPVSTVTFTGEDVPETSGMDVFDANKPITIYVPLIVLSRYRSYVTAIGLDLDNMCVLRGVDY